MFIMASVSRLYLQYLTHPPRDGQEKKAEKRSNSVNFIVASHILF
ncbi:hypothetical protein ACU8KH_03799 [Lachancea thermotolerans]